MRLVNLATLLSTTTAAGQFVLGEPVECMDDTYGFLKAVWVYFQASLSVVGAPVYPDITADIGETTVDENEDETGVIGQPYCVGAALSSAAVSGAFYGFVLVQGRNPIALVTDGNVDAGDFLMGSTTDGTWNGVAPSADTSASVTAYLTRGYQVATALADDATAAQVVNTARFHSVWA